MTTLTQSANSTYCKTRSETLSATRYSIVTFSITKSEHSSDGFLVHSADWRSRRHPAQTEIVYILCTNAMVSGRLVRPDKADSFARSGIRAAWSRRLACVPHITFSNGTSRVKIGREVRFTFQVARFSPSYAKSKTWRTKMLLWNVRTRRRERLSKLFHNQHSQNWGKEWQRHKAIYWNHTSNYSWVGNDGAVFLTATSNTGQSQLRS